MILIARNIPGIYHVHRLLHTVHNKRTNMLMEDLRLTDEASEAAKTERVLNVVRGPRVNFKLLQGLASLPDNVFKEPAPEDPVRRLAA